MADPAVVPCPADVWTKVATDQTSGVVHIISSEPNVYLQTYRDTGATAPTDKTGAVQFDSPLCISASLGIDVYIRPVGVAGSVRVDL